MLSVTDFRRQLFWFLLIGVCWCAWSTAQGNKAQAQDFRGQGNKTKPATSSNEIQLTTEIDQATSDPASQFLLLVEDKQWQRAAAMLIALRDENARIRVGGMVPMDPPRTGTETFLSASSYLNEVANRHLSKHPELLAEWSRQIQVRVRELARQIEITKDAFQASEIAKRYALAPDVGSDLALRAATLHADKGNLAEAIDLLAALDIRFDRFRHRFAGKEVEPATGQNSNLPEASAAEVAARLVVLDELRHPGQHAARNLSWFQENFGSQSGQLGSANGNLLAALKELLPTLAPDAMPTEQADAPANSKPTMQPWTIVLAESTPPDPAESESAESAESVKAAAKKPILLRPQILDDKLIWKDRNHFYIANIATGNPYFNQSKEQSASIDELADFQVFKNVRTSSRSNRNNLPQVHSLHLQNESAFAIFDYEEFNCIVGIDLQQQGKLLPGFPILPPDSNWQFEGTPVVNDGMLYVLARQHSTGNRLINSVIICYALRRNEFSAPLPIQWTTTVCRAELPNFPGNTFVDGQSGSQGNSQLVLDEGQLLFCNDNGVIGAIELENGRLNWLVKYSRINFADRQAMFQSRLSRKRISEPPLVFEDSMFVLPQDSSNLIALNKHNGTVNWQVRLPACHQILDCDANSLVLAGDQLVWLDPGTGEILARHPEEFPNTLPGMRAPIHATRGRAVVADGKIWMPTNRFLFSIPRDFSNDNDQAKNLVPQISLKDSFRGGHLMVEQRMMLIANEQLLQLIPLDALTGNRIKATDAK